MHPFVNNKYRLERFEEKGGWTFVRIPGIKQGNKKGGRVKGSIDGYAISKLSLMPFADGDMMLPVKAEIRKHINKKAGDWIHIILYPDTDELEIPEDLQLCLNDEPRALKFFNALSESERKYYIDWVASAKREETRTGRLAKTINRLMQGIKLYDKLPG